MGGVVVFGGVRVEVQQRGNALRNGARGEHHHRAVGNALRLLGGHDDIFVVGQHEYGFCGNALHRGDNIRGGGVHRLPARDDGVRAEIGEDVLQALARGHGHKTIGAVVIDGGVGKAAAHARGLGRGLLFQALALRLPRKKLLVHVLDFKVRQIAVLQRMADDPAGIGRVNMTVDHLVVLNDDNTVAVALQKGAQLAAAGAGVFVYQKLRAIAVLDILHLHQVIGVNTLSRAAGGKLGALFHRFARGHNLAVAQYREHALKDIHKALPARVHNAGLFQHGQLFGRVLQRALRRGAHQLPQLYFIGNAAGGGLLAGHARHGEHRALGGLHHGLVGALHAHFQRVDKIGGVRRALALQRLGKTAEQQAGNNARVAARAAQHGAGSHLRRLFHGAVVRQIQKLAARRADGHAHIGAGVAVRHGEHIQFIYLRAAVGKAVCTGYEAVF